jgi:hypothetical protein
LHVDPDAPGGRDEKQQGERATKHESASGTWRAQIGLRDDHSYTDIVVETSKRGPRLQTGETGFQLLHRASLQVKTRDGRSKK